MNIYMRRSNIPYNPLSCRSFSTKEPLNIGHFCGKLLLGVRRATAPRSAYVHTDF